MNCPVKFELKKIFRFTKYNVLNDTKTLEKRWTRHWKVIFWSFWTDPLIDDLGILKYLVIFPNEKGQKFHYKGEAASIIQPIEERVADYIRLQTQGGCKTRKYIQQRVAYFANQCKCGKIRTRITPNTDNFHAVCVTRNRNTNVERN